MSKLDKIDFRKFAMEVIAINAQAFSTNIKSEPVGFIVYISKDGSNLSLANFCTAADMQVLDVMKILTASSGFKAEPEDAMGFFLFEDNAKKFIDALMSA